MTESEKKSDIKSTRGQAFVTYIVNVCQKDKGLAAALKRADVASLQYQSWSILLGFGVNIEQDSERVIFTTIAAALAKGKITEDGPVPFMRALAKAYDVEGADPAAPAAMRLRRLLACSSVVECCKVLRPMIGLVLSKSEVPVDFGALTDDLLSFDWKSDRVKTRWAADFYRRELNQ